MMEKIFGKFGLNISPDVCAHPHNNIEAISFGSSTTYCVTFIERWEKLPVDVFGHEIKCDKR